MNHRLFSRLVPLGCLVREPIAAKPPVLSPQLYQQMAEARKLDARIRRNLETLGYGG